MLQVKEKTAGEKGREYAFRVLRENIINLNMVPGSSINEKEIADQLGLSRTPVREALLELAKGRIVEIFPQKGSRVSLVDYGLVEEARFMRSVLERGVVELACETAAKEDIFKMEENVKLQQFYLENRSPGKLLELDDEFHKMLFHAARKPQVYQVMGVLMIHFDRVRSMSLETVKDLKTVEDHREILTAVRQKNREQAVKIMDRHLGRVLVDQTELRDTYQGWFQ